MTAWAALLFFVAAVLLAEWINETPEAPDDSYRVDRERDGVME